MRLLSYTRDATCGKLGTLERTRDIWDLLCDAEGGGGMLQVSFITAGGKLALSIRDSGRFPLGLFPGPDHQLDNQEAHRK